MDFLRHAKRLSEVNLTPFPGVILGRKRLECFDGERWKDLYRDFD